MQDDALNEAYLFVRERSPHSIPSAFHALRPNEVRRLRGREFPGRSFHHPCHPRAISDTRSDTCRERVVDRPFPKKSNTVRLMGRGIDDFDTVEKPSSADLRNGMEIST